MKKQIIIFSSLLVLVGCSENVSNISNHFTKQHSIEQQKRDAQNAWDELDGKTVSVKQSTQKSANNLNSIKKVQKVDVSNVVKNMLETSDKIPDWFYSVPKSQEYFYGAGEGRNANEAKNSALNYIASQIQTTISSEFSKTSAYSKSDYSSSFYESARKNINANVSKISFSNIQIVKTVKVDNEIYILLRVNKQELFRNLKTKFEILDEKIDSEIKTSQKYSLLDQLITLNKLTPKIADALNDVTILSVLNPNFDVKPYVRKYNSYIEKKSEIYHKLTFKLKDNNPFASKLIEVMNENSYKIGNSSNVKIRVLPNIRYSTPLGMSVARVTVTIQVFAKNKILKSTSFEVKGISNTKSQAIAKAAIAFKAQLEEIGINKLLGFE
jgi:hypothetical protein